MEQRKENELDSCIEMMDEYCPSWEFEALRGRVLGLLDDSTRTISAFETPNQESLAVPGR